MNASKQNATKHTTRQTQIKTDTLAHTYGEMRTPAPQTKASKAEENAGRADSALPFSFSLFVCFAGRCRKSAMTSFNNQQSKAKAKQSKSKSKSKKQKQRRRSRSRRL